VSAPPSTLRRAAPAIALAAVLACLYLLSLRNYLLFHAIVEGFAIVIAFGLFALAWNARRYLDNHYLLFVGIGSAFVGFLDGLHLLAYRGMGVFSASDAADLPTQLWIAGRYVQVLALLPATLFIRRRLPVGPVVAGFAAVTGLLLHWIFAGRSFPACFVEGTGLTPFKVASEYVVCALIALALVLLRRSRERLAPGTVRLLTVAMAATIASELSFTLYADVYGVANVVGHLLKVAAFYALYRAVLESGLKRPYELLFRDLLARESHFRSLAEHSPDAILRFDPDLRLIYANPAARSLPGLDQQAPLGRPLAETGVPVSLADPWSAKLQEVMRTRTVATADLSTGGTAEPRHYQALIAPEAGRDGAVQSLLSIVRDLTELKEAESLKDEFLGIVSHELRTPVTVVLGALKVAHSEGIRSEDAADLVREAEAAAEHLAKLLENMLELSRFQADRLQLAAQRLDPGAAAETAVAKVHARAAGHRFTVSVEPGLPPVEADPLRLQLVLRNLLDNAVKYAPESSEIRVTVRRDDGTVLLSVADQGPGIHPAEQAKLFRQFERLRQEAGRKPGLGLGLLVCRRLVEAHGGRIWVESQPGRGTTLSFTLPLPEERGE